MKLYFLVIFVCYFLLFSCSTRDPLAYTKGIQLERLNLYEESTLRSFFDSISNINLNVLKLQVGISEEEQFRAIKPLNIVLSDADFNEIKHLFAQQKNAWIDLDIAKRVFSFPIDSIYIENNQVAIGIVSFDNRIEDWNEFVLYIGSAPQFAWKNDYYFFNKNRVIAFQQNHHQYGVEINHFKDQENKTVIYYRENFASGTGIWQFNYFFYRYNEHKLEPVLNILQNSNLNESSYKTLWFETKIEATKPLTLKFTYSIEFHDIEDNKMLLKNDSSTVVYNWDNKNRCYKGKFSSHFKEDEILAYYLINGDSYLIRYYKNQINQLLDDEKNEGKNAVFFYLNVIKNNLESL